MRQFEIIFNGVSIKTESTLVAAKQFARYYCADGETAEIVAGVPGSDYEHVCWVTSPLRE